MKKEHVKNQIPIECQKLFLNAARPRLEADDED